MPELRYLAARGAIRLDPPLPPPCPRTRPARRSTPPSDTTYYPPLLRAKTEPRECMTCGEIFLSEGNHHRLCARHRRESEETVYGVNAPFNLDG